MVYNVLALQPPEAITAFNVTRNDKNGDRNLQLACKNKSVRIVILISIIKADHQRCAAVMYLPFLARPCIEFFQCCLNIEYTIVTAQIREMKVQGSPSCTVVIKDNQMFSRALSPVAYQFHQAGVVKTGC